MSRAWVLVGSALLAGLVPLPAYAQSPSELPPSSLPIRRAEFGWDKSTGAILHATFEYKDVIDREIATKLASGLPTVIVMRASVHPEVAPNREVDGSVMTCRIVFDVWDEVYRIEIQERLRVSQPGTKSTTVAPNLAGVLRKCAEARDLAVADKSSLQPDASYFLVVVVDVNPVSKEMLDRIRMWVSRPPGSTSGTPGDSLFGSFVGLFVARVGQAERSLSFRTQSVYVPR